MLLVVGKRNRGRPKLRLKDVCKRDLKSLNITTDELELLANDRTNGDYLYAKDCWKENMNKKSKKMKKLEAE